MKFDELKRRKSCQQNSDQTEFSSNGQNSNQTGRIQSIQAELKLYSQNFQQ